MSCRLIVLLSQCLVISLFYNCYKGPPDFSLFLVVLIQTSFLTATGAKRSQNESLEISRNHKQLVPKIMIC